MANLNELLNNIDKLRENLNYLINEKQGNLLDEDVITVSKLLDILIIEYNKIIESKINK